MKRNGADAQPRTTARGDFTQTSPVRICLLGPPLIRGEEHVTVLRASRRTNLLVALVAARCRPVSLARLATELWPDGAPRHARNAMEAQISRLRADLVGWGLPTAGYRIRAQLRGYSLECDPDSVDALAFERLTQHAIGLRADAPDRALGLTRQALRLWRDVPLAGLIPGEDGLALRVTLQERHLRVLHTHADCLLAVGEYGEAIELLAEAIVRHPHNEQFHELLITALFRAGQPDRALRAYQELYRRLRQDLGVGPSARLRQMYTSLLRQGEDEGAAAPHADRAMSVQSGCATMGSMATARHVHDLQAQQPDGAGGQADDGQRLLETMVLSREFDRRAALSFRQGRVWFHISSAGHEALAALAPLLRDDDLIAPHYRDRALLLARGVPLADMAHALFAAAGGDSRGRNMAAHFSHREHNVFAVASPVASNCLPAAGYAWAAQLRGSDAVVLCLTGDASTRQGEFYEAVAFAAEKQLPVVFVVEDNGYGISTPTARSNPRSLGLLGADLVVDVDGADTEAVAAAASDAITAARRGTGPRVLWCSLDRLGSHTSADDQRVYRDPDELAQLRDPVRSLADRLIERGVLDAQRLEDMQRRAVAQVAAVFEAAAAAPVPDPDDVLDQLFAPTGQLPAPAAPDESPPTIAEAVRQALGRAAADPRTVIFGEDVEDPKGGVFGLTKGLSSSGRVFNSPLAEATIVGIGVGLAAAGLRPIVELQFVDFAAPAWNQITTQLATLRWRTHGAWQCPVTVYAPCGAYLPGGGIWHSQTNESLYTHVPGLRVAVPCTPQDADSVFERAAAGHDPVIVLLPKHLLRRARISTAPSGRTLLRRGGEATVVAWGNSVELALSAAEMLADDAIETEVLGLCWLDPCDIESVRDSVRRTGRLVVVQEDVAASSFGAWVIAAVLEDEATFYRLLAQPKLISRLHVHVPFNPALEAAVLPSAATVAEAVRDLTGKGRS
jgi:2-oxoisovalerate dehydrogenase E1 component